MPQNFVIVRSTNYKILTQRIIWKIPCVVANDIRRQDDRIARRRTAWLERIVRRESDESRTNQGRNDDIIVTCNAATTMALQLVMLLLLRLCLAAMLLLLLHGIATALLHGVAVVARHCSDGAPTTRCCNDGAATAQCCCCVALQWWRYGWKKIVFFLLESFRRENESEKEKKERDSKPVSQLYWLA